MPKHAKARGLRYRRRPAPTTASPCHAGPPIAPLSSRRRKNHPSATRPSEPGCKNRGHCCAVPLVGFPSSLSKLYDAGVFIRKNARPGAEWIQKAARKAEPVVRAGAKIGKGFRNVGTRMSAAAGAFRDPEGKNLETERQVRRAGDTTQKYGERISAGSEVAGAVLSVVEALTGVFKSPEPMSIDPRREGEEPSKDAGEAPATDGRFLPHQPDKRPSAPAGGRTEPVPDPPQPGADSDSGGDVQKTEAELLHGVANCRRKGGNPAGTPPRVASPRRSDANLRRNPRSKRRLPTVRK